MRAVLRLVLRYGLGRWLSKGTNTRCVRAKLTSRDGIFGRVARRRRVQHRRFEACGFRVQVVGELGDLPVKTVNLGQLGVDDLRCASWVQRAFNEVAVPNG
jgi:hypothetical protein